MANRKTQENTASVKDFIANIKNETRRKDSQVVLKMLQSITEEKPKMWGSSIVGFGKHHYKLANGKDAEICKVGFSPIAQALVFYLSNFEERAILLEQLGKHKLSGGGCLYINKLADVDISILETLIEKAYHRKE